MSFRTHPEESDSVRAPLSLACLCQLRAVTQEFLRTALQHPDLKLFATNETPQLSDEQKERMFIIFSMLISLFERAYLLLYDETMTSKQRRRWLSWEDYMRDWCRRADFRRLRFQGETASAMASHHGDGALNCIRIVGGDRHHFFRSAAAKASSGRQLLGRERPRSALCAQRSCWRTGNAIRRSCALNWKFSPACRDRARHPRAP